MNKVDRNDAKMTLSSDLQFSGNSRDVCFWRRSPIWQRLPRSGRLPVFWRPQAVRQRKLPYYTTPHAMLSISKCHKAWSACVRFKDAINLRLRVPQEFITSKTHFIASTYCSTLYWCPVDKLNTETMWTIGPRRK